MHHQVEHAFQSAVKMFVDRESGLPRHIHQNSRATFEFVLLQSQLPSEPERQVARDMLKVWDGPTENFWVDAQPIYRRVQSLGVDLKGRLPPGWE